jgi:hypothetical protein
MTVNLSIGGGHHYDYWHLCILNTANVNLSADIKMHVIHGNNSTTLKPASYIMHVCH